MIKKLPFSFRQFSNCILIALSLQSGYLISQNTTFTYNFTGSVQTFTVPSCVSTLSLDVRGAQGGTAVIGGNGGLGGLAYGVISVTPGDILSIYVGGQNGYNGGGLAGVSTCTQAMGGPGGGASDIRFNGNALSNRVIVAGGGGGGGGDRVQGCGRGTGGGGGGGYYGGGGGAGWGTTTVPTGGSQTAGGTGGISSTTSQNGQNGGLGFGGNGGGETGSNQASTGAGLAGGAGGGLTGGNGAWTTAFTGQSGAGGSGWINSSLTNTSITSNSRTGNGVVILSFIYNGGVVTASASNTLICSGASVALTTSGTVLSYTWNTGSNNSSITVSPTTNTIYSVMSTNSLNCISTSTVAVIVNPGTPTLTIASSASSVCLGAALSLTASGANTYTWTNSVLNGVAFTPTGTATYVVSGANACGTSTAATTITVAPLPVSAISSPTSFCSGLTTTITAVATATTYTLSSPSSISTSGSFVIGPPVSTIFTVTASDGTCSGTATVGVLVLPIPTVNVAQSASVVCEGDTVTFTASGGLTYTWSGTGSNNPNVTYTVNAPTAYSVTATNSLGCSSGTTAIVLTNPSPTLNVSASHNFICNGESTTLTASGAGTYTWSSGPTTSITVESPLSTTIYTVTGDLNGCVKTETLLVDVFTPSVAVNGPTAICSGNSATLMAMGATNYTWNATQPSAIYVVSPVSTTIYTVSAITATGNLNCASTTTVQLLVNNTPTVSAVAQRTVMCVKESNTLTASGAGTYSWNTGASGAQLAFTPSLVTTIIYTVIGTSANGCEATATVQVKINGCVGVNELDANNKILSVYPNPNSGSFHVSTQEDITLVITNQLGQVVKEISLDESNERSATISGLSKGLYFISGKNARLNAGFKVIVE